MERRKRERERERVASIPASIQSRIRTLQRRCISPDCHCTQRQLLLQFHANRELDYRMGKPSLLSCKVNNADFQRVGRIQGTIDTRLSFLFLLPFFSFFFFSFLLELVHLFQKEIQFPLPRYLTTVLIRFARRFTESKLNFQAIHGFGLTYL